MGVPCCLIGKNSYVNLGLPASFQSTGSMTWSAWVYATGNPSDDGQIIAMSTDNSGWQLKTSPDTGVRTFGVAVSPDGTTHTQRYSKTVFSPTLGITWPASTTPLQRLWISTSMACWMTVL